MKPRERLTALLVSSMLLAGCGSDSSATPSAPDCDSPGQACTWAGLVGAEGFNGDGRHRLETELYWAMDVLFLSDGSPWFIDWNNHLVRRVLADDTVETVVGWINPVFPGDGEPANAERTPVGALGTDVQLNHPTDMLELADGSILLSAWHNHKLRRIDPATGYVWIECGAGAGYAGDGGPAKGALFRQPSAVQLDGEQAIYVLDQQNFRIRRIAEDSIQTVAGKGVQGSGGDGGPGVEAELGFAAGSNPEPSGGLAYDDGKLYFSDTLNHRIRRLDLATGRIEAFAGTGEAGFGGDGEPRLDATFAGPHDLEIGPDGDLYVADTDNHRIRAIDLTTGIVRTVAGSGAPREASDEGVPALGLSLRRPFGIAFDREGHLFVSDTINSRIVRVSR